MLPLDSTLINFNDAGENVVVEADSTKQVCVFRLFFVVSAATIITFLDAESGAPLTGPISLNAGAAFVLDTSNDEQPWFTSEAGEAFVISSTNAVQVSGRVYFLRQ